MVTFQKSHRSYQAPVYNSLDLVGPFSTDQVIFKMQLMIPHCCQGSVKELS